MKRAILLTIGWLVATPALYAALVSLELYWNLYNWRPRVDLVAVGLISAIFGLLAGIWFLARVGCDRLSQGVSLAACLGLVALAIYVFPPEPLTAGLFARESPSPLWYRGGRFVVLVLPGMFWAVGRAWRIKF